MKMPNIQISNILAKTTGLVGLGLVAYDSHYAGKIQASRTERDIKTDSLEKHYMDDMKLDSPSVVQNSIKKRMLEFHEDEGFTGFFTNIAGYVKGFGSMLITNVIPLGLAAGTFIGKKGGRNLISKFSAVGLAAYGGIYLAKEFFGIGNNHETPFPN